MHWKSHFFRYFVLLIHSYLFKLFLCFSNQIRTPFIYQHPQPLSAQHCFNGLDQRNICIFFYQVFYLMLPWPKMNGTGLFFFFFFIEVKLQKWRFVQCNRKNAERNVIAQRAVNGLCSYSSIKTCCSAEKTKWILYKCSRLFQQETNTHWYINHCKKNA